MSLSSRDGMSGVDFSHILSDLESQDMEDDHPSKGRLRKVVEYSVDYDEESGHYLDNANVDYVWTEDEADDYDEKRPLAESDELQKVKKAGFKKVVNYSVDYEQSTGYYVDNQNIDYVWTGQDDESDTASLLPKQQQPTRRKRLRPGFKKVVNYQVDYDSDEQIYIDNANIDYVWTDEMEISEAESLLPKPQETEQTEPRTLLPKPQETEQTEPRSPRLKKVVDYAVEYDSEEEAYIDKAHIDFVWTGDEDDFEDEALLPKDSELSDGPIVVVSTLRRRRRRMIVLIIVIFLLGGIATGLTFGVQAMQQSFGEVGRDAGGGTTEEREPPPIEEPEEESEDEKNRTKTSDWEPIEEKQEVNVNVRIVRKDDGEIAIEIDNEVTVNLPPGVAAKALSERAAAFQALDAPQGLFAGSEARVDNSTSSIVIDIETGAEVDIDTRGIASDTIGSRAGS